MFVIIIIVIHRSSVFTVVSLPPSPLWIRYVLSIGNKKFLTTVLCVTYSGLTLKVHVHELLHVYIV